VIRGWKDFKTVTLFDISGSAELFGDNYSAKVVHSADNADNVVFHFHLPLFW
jgi:hypothetical protein